MCQDAYEVRSSLSLKDTKKRLSQVNKEKNVSSKLRKTGLALIALPDPLTDIPGVAFLAASFFLKEMDSISAITLQKNFKSLYDELVNFRV